jgi:hypothetical protein
MTTEMGLSLFHEVSGPMRPSVLRSSSFGQTLKKSAQHPSLSVAGKVGSTCSSWLSQRRWALVLLHQRLVPTAGACRRRVPLTAIFRSPQLGTRMSGGIGYRAAYIAHASATVMLPHPNSLAARTLRRLDMVEAGAI